MLTSNTSEHQRTRALTRWKNVRNRIFQHLATIAIEDKSIIFKARLHACLVADGSVTLSREKKRPTSCHHDIRFYPDHESLIEPFREAFAYLYLQMPSVTKLHNFYAVRASSQAACEDLMQLGAFKALQWSIPDTILSTVEAKREWLRAFFDCEGYVSPKSVRIESVNEAGIYRIQELLRDFHIESRTYRYVRKNPKWNVNFILCIGRKQDRQTFLKEIGFNHALKQEKLQNLLASVR
jgi:hypothetical protein